MSDVVGTSIHSEPFSVLEISKTPTTTQEQEVNKLYEFLKVERNKYNEYKLLCDVLEESDSESSDLDQTLKDKVMDIMLSGSVTQNLTLDECKCGESTTVLGLTEINEQELSYPERYDLAEALRVRLDNKYESVCDEFRKVTGKDIEKVLESPETSMPLELPSEDRVLLEYKNKLLLEQELYVKNLLNLSELLNEITNLRLKKLPEVTEQKIRECQVEEKINHLKSMLAQEKVRIDIFTETSSSLKAYKELIKDIKDQQEEFEKEIGELKDLKEKYKQVSCKQFDDILKSYRDYKLSIEKKKLLYECLKT